MRSDFDLLSAWRGGDDAAGQQLVRRHYGSVFGFFRSKADDAAADLTQRTFLVCLETAAKYRRDASMRAFLLGIGRRVLLESLRQRFGPSAVDPELVAARDISPTPSGIVAQREEERVLLAALRAIPLDFQVTIELFFWEHLSVDEVAGVLEVAPGTVKSRLHRAKQMLRRELERMDISEVLRNSTMGGLASWAEALRKRVDTGLPGEG